MTFTKKIWTLHRVGGKKEKIIEVCCEKFAKDEFLDYEDKYGWCFGEAIILCRDLKFCPYCGEKLYQ